MIAIIDYGMGNLRSVQKGFERVGFEAVVTRDAGEIQSARGVVLPGVGAFSACMENLERFGLVAPIREIVRDQNRFSAFAWDFNCSSPKARSSATRKVSICFGERSSVSSPPKI